MTITFENLTGVEIDMNQEQRHIEMARAYKLGRLYREMSGGEEIPDTTAYFGVRTGMMVLDTVHDRLFRVQRILVSYGNTYVDLDFVPDSRGGMDEVELTWPLDLFDRLARCGCLEPVQVKMCNDDRQPTVRRSEDWQHIRDALVSLVHRLDAELYGVESEELVMAIWLSHASEQIIKHAACLESETQL